MRWSVVVSLIVLGTLACCMRVQAPPAGEGGERTVREAAGEARPLVYPPARRGEVKDVYHGVEVADPYRWLEDPESEETRAWIEAENALTFGFLSEIEARAAIRARLEALWDYEKTGVPDEEGGRLFYTYNPGLLAQPQILVQAGPGATPRVLLDPNGLSKDGTVAVSAWAPSRDGRYLAYALSEAGSDWKTWKVREVETGKDLPDEIPWSKFSGAAWAADGSGFYYSAYDPPKDAATAERGTNYFQKLYFHRLGTSARDDRLVYERKDQKEWGFSADVSDDGDTLVLHVWKGTAPENQLFTLDLRDPQAKVVERIRGFDALWELVGTQGHRLYLRTTKDAPRSRIVALDLDAPQAEPWEVVPEADDALESAHLVGGRILAVYLHDARHVLRVYEPRASGLARDLGAVSLPAMGTIAGLRGHGDRPLAYFAFTSFTYPMTVFALDTRRVGRGEAVRVFRRPKVDFDPGAFETRQIFVRSKDGTRVPAFITHKKGLVLDGKRPTYLYGYGGFDVSLTPYYSTANLVWMEMGGVFVSANLRGGGEYGEAWHKAGTLEHKQNVFDDFDAVARYLVEAGITRPSRLAIGGGSNGGLLVGASITQHPEDFGAAICAVGVLDMLRYHKWTIGWAWASDYGTSDDPKLFPVLLSYSPLHNVRPGTHYPATLITTADHDDRVVPAHSFKFAAALQHAQAGPAPVLIRIETRAGHGAGKPTAKILDEVADRWAFLYRVLGGLEAP